MQACDIIAYSTMTLSLHPLRRRDRHLFRLYPDVVAANGTLLADGINSAGISYEEASELVARHDKLRGAARRAA
jgi:hypothetical protein